MNMYEIITNKKQKKALSDEEIKYFVKGITSGEIPDYQTSALLMAICLNGMTDEETWALTDAMTHSGDVLDLSGINGIKVDKHSTGGVGDKTTLVLAPMLAACGLKVAKMSGRALGHTGGTIDKLESIKNFRTSLSEEEFEKNVNEIGIAVAAQTAKVAPADKKLYALRDVTATVDNISLITSSIMSKKLACGAQCMVLDVKCGSGSFMQTTNDARELAEKMVAIGRRAGKNVSAVISDMNQPLGYAVGNALEVKEAIDTLHGKGPKDLTELCLTLGSCLLVSSKVAKDNNSARTMLKESITQGNALEKFKQFIKSQGGDEAVADDTSKLPIAPCLRKVISDRNGYVANIACSEIGIASLLSGAGREKKDDPIDFGAGLVIKAKVGDYLNIGDEIATIYAQNEEKLSAAALKLTDAYSISEEKPDELKFIYEVIL